MATKVEILSNVSVLVADTQAARASQLTDALREASIEDAAVALSLKEVQQQMSAGDFDVLILSDTLGARLFELTRMIRQNRIGKNPFMTILCALAPEHVDGAKLALMAGVDNILIQPVQAKHVIDRMRKISRTQTPFVVTSEYIGPDRRANERTSAIRRFYVPQALRDKMLGKKINYDDFAKEVAPIVEDMLQTRLNAMSSRMAMISGELVSAFKAGDITTVVKEKLEIICDILKQSAATAKQINKADLAELCAGLEKQIADIAARYTDAAEGDAALIEKAAETFAKAVREGVDVVEAENAAKEEERDLSCPDLEEPAIEIQFITKGQTLFKEGDKAVAAYVVAAGCMGIFRNVDGIRSPVARIRKGEFFGEMAILDGSDRRATAVALEDTTLSLVSKESLEEKMAESHELIRLVLSTAVYNLRRAHDTYTQRARSLQDMLKSISLSRHVSGRFIEKLDLGEDKEKAKDILKSFDAKFSEVVSACAPIIAADRRKNPEPGDDDLTKDKAT